MTVAATTVNHAVSRDGTEIGWFSGGEGPALVLVHGLLGDHTRWEVLLPYLREHFTVHAVDRCGRGASGDHAEYDGVRECEDVAAVVEAVANEAGAAVDVYGSSGGGSFALRAATLTDSIRRLVLFEPPGRQVVGLLPDRLLDELDALLDAGEREALLGASYRHLVGLSDADIEHLRGQPEWPNRVAAAHTVPRELRVAPEAFLTPDEVTGIGLPTLVMIGGTSPPQFRAAGEALAAALPNGDLAMLEGQGHGAEMLAPGVVAEAVLGFLVGGGLPSGTRWARTRR